MALANYTDLQTAVTNWMANSSLSGEAADFITLGEAALNREINATGTEVDVTLTGTAGVNDIDISAYLLMEPIALFLDETGMDEVMLQPQAEGTYEVSVTEGRPSIWSIDGTSINFDCPLLDAYPFRFRYRQRFALSDLAPTNWLLTNHPDVYLAATLVWSGLYKRDRDIPSQFAQVLAQGIPAIKNLIAQSSRGTLRVDRGLLSGGRFTYADWSNLS